MKFTYEGREWDTDKNVWVAGYLSDLIWYPIFRGNREELAEMMKMYVRSIRVKVAYINGAAFDYNEELQKSYVKEFYIRCTDSILSYDSSEKYLIGRSHDEVMEILKNERII